jgi:hypothetical protein
VISVLDHRKGFGHTDLVSDLGTSNVVPDAIEEAGEDPSRPAIRPNRRERSAVRPHNKV